ncbi:MAG: hypothetical protein KatS3mg022_2585 [Armatimonadota bacterium]|nr:MAG: hypothetical protein KatS3mg022_2585 [Armatimonadota bacterium]
MESIVGGRGGVISAHMDNGSAAALISLFSSLQRESAEQTLFALALLDHYEQKLLDALLPDETLGMNLSVGHAPS